MTNLNLPKTSCNRILSVLSTLGVLLSGACAVHPETDSAQAEAVDHDQLRQIKQGQILEAPTPLAVTDNPLLGANLFVDPESLAMLQANSLRATNPEQAAVLDRIAQQPMALWMGGWNSDIYRAVDHFVERARAEDAIPVMIAYNIPLRDCGQHSQGGLSTKEEYQRWIRLVHAGIGQRPAVVILEPDALGLFQECLTEEQRQERLFLIGDAIKVLRQDPTTAVYVDAGHPRWVPAPEMAQRLLAAGATDAHGFSLNVSNYISTEENLRYGHELSALLGGKRFVIDTSRNGAGPYDAAQTIEESWCNPPGRKIGRAPSTETGDELCDAFLWLKRPGESDGQCHGGPRAGVFWLDRALEMARLE